MKDAVLDLLLIVNIKAEKCGYSYNFQSERCYNNTHKTLYSRQSILKYYGRKLVEKTKVYSMIATINYLSNEIKQYDKMNNK